MIGQYKRSPISWRPDLRLIRPLAIAAVYLWMYFKGQFWPTV